MFKVNWYISMLPQMDRLVRAVEAYDHHAKAERN
jgi:hypothetical protein